ncbi:MAG TPA: sialidase family protein [Ktedonobacterales bacterium]|jgi:hypothetical protein
MTRESHDPTEFEPLPPELEALHYRLLADGAVWRDGLPSTEHLEERLSQIHSQERVPQPARARTARQEAVTTPFPASTKGVVSVFPGRIKTITAIVAIAAVVALFAFLLRGFAIGHINTGAGAPSPTSGQSTQVAPGYYDSYFPVIAPSDPQVIYKVAQKGQATPEMLLARSDDGGHTWQTFALPAGKANDQLLPYVYVSPLNAHYVFLLVDTRQKYGDCTASQAFAGGSSPLVAHSGGNPLCSADTTYLSTDGGQHWTQPQFPQTNTQNSQGLLPVPGDTPVQSLSTTSIPDSVQVFRAQGNRLYTYLGVHVGSTAAAVVARGRLVTSTDGGLTWSLADNGLPSNLCDYSPTPTGSTIFAVVGTCSSEVQGKWTFWRSDDAGKHWTQLFQLKSSAVPYEAFLFMGIVAVQPSDGAQPLLYLDLADTANGFSPSPETVSVYGTSERALLDAPTQGFPAGQNPGRPLGVLSDGSVLFATDDGFYSWKAGDVSWKKLAPKVNGVLAYAFVAAPGADGKQALVVVTTDNKITRLGV